MEIGGPGLKEVDLYDMKGYGDIQSAFAAAGLSIACCFQAQRRWKDIATR